MLKKKILFILPIFILFAFFGFKIADSLFQKKGQSVIQIANVVPTGTPAQENFLILHVDDLSAKKPGLVSAWSVFLYPSNPPHLMVMPLTSPTDADRSQALTKAFRIKSNKQVSGIFLSEIKQRFDLEHSGYILIDDTSADLFFGWLTGLQPVPPGSEQDPMTSAALNADLEANAWAQFCQITAAGSGGSFFNSINWNLVLPDHFVTDLSFDAITLAIDQLRHSSTPPACEVLTP